MKKRSNRQTGTTCPSCGKGKLTFKAGKRDLGPLLGLNEVTVENLSAPSCPTCRAILVPGEVLDLVSLAIAGSMLTQAELEPIEVRFLRKLLEYTQAGRRWPASPPARSPRSLFSPGRARRARRNHGWSVDGERVMGHTAA